MKSMSGNKHQKTTFLRNLSLLFFVLLISVSVKISAAGTSSWSNTFYPKYSYESFSSYAPARQRIDMKNIDYPLLHAAIFYESNRIRVKYNKSRLRHSAALERAAFGHSKDMVEQNFFDHYNPKNFSKYNMKARLALEGIRNTESSENIAYTFGIQYEGGRGVYSPAQNGGYFSYSYKGDPIPNHTYLTLAQAVVIQWYNSPGHRRNMLSPNFKYLGTGAYHYQNQSFYNMDMFKMTQNFASVVPDDIYDKTPVKTNRGTGNNESSPEKMENKNKIEVLEQ